MGASAKWKRIPGQTLSAHWNKRKKEWTRIQAFITLSVLTTLILLLISETQPLCDYALSFLSLGLQCLTISASFCGDVCVSLGKHV